MKKIILLAPLFLAASIAFSQENNEPKADTTRIKLGATTIIFIENDTVAGPQSNHCKPGKKGKDTTGLDLTLALDYGMNGYMAPDFGLSLPAGQDLLELDYPESKMIGFSFMLTRADIIRNRLYISPGLGVNWNKYRFENNVAISTSNDATEFAFDSLIQYDKYKLRVTYLQVPLVLGARIGNLKHPLGLQVGVVGSYKIGSLIKQEYETGDAEYKTKVEDDFNINPFKFEAIARIGIKNFGLYARYSLTTLFEEDKAPELYPFSVGITLGGFLDK